MIAVLCGSDYEYRMWKQRPENSTRTSQRVSKLVDCAGSYLSECVELAGFSELREADQSIIRSQVIQRIEWVRRVERRLAV